MSIETDLRDASAEAPKPGTPLELECTVCGFRGSTLGPRDAIVAIRSLPRRYRAGMARAFAEDDADAILALRAAHDWWSPLELAGHVRDVLHTKEKRLLRVLRERDPMLSVEQEMPPTGVEAQGAEVILAGLQMNADALARSAETIEGREWARGGQRAGTEVAALDLVREAVHEGVHHLRDLDRAMRAALSMTRT